MALCPKLRRLVFASGRTGVVRAHPTLTTSTGLAVGFGPRVTLVDLIDLHSPLSYGSPVFLLGNSTLALQPQKVV